jgi:glycosyl transferase, family 25
MTDFNKDSDQDILDIPIFIIHYKKLSQRKEYLLRMLSKFNFRNITFFEDLDRDTLTEDDLSYYKYDPNKWSSKINMFNEISEPRPLTNSEIAVTLSHIKIYEYIVKNNIEIALILEDDCIFYNDFKDILNKIIIKLKKYSNFNLYFDMCFLSDSVGWTVDNYKFGYFGLKNKNIFKPNQLVYEMGCGRTADAYLISLNGSKKLSSKMNKNEKFVFPIDWEFNWISISLGMKIFWAEPAIIHPGSEDVYKSANRSSEFNVFDNKNNITTEQIITLFNRSSENVRYSRISGTIHCDIKSELESQSKDRLKQFTSYLKSNKNFILVKEGDGEFFNMASQNQNDHNCDGNNYFRSLGDDLIESYIWYLRNKDAYICRWHSHIFNMQNEMDQHNIEHYSPKEKFVYYDLIVHKLPFKQEQIDFFLEIKRSNRKKFYISNMDMIKAVKNILNINYALAIPERNSHLIKKDIIEKALEQLSLCSDMIVMVSGGMFSKVLICELAKARPNNTYIDIGSTFDGLIKRSRDFNGTLEYRNELLKYYS